MSMKQRRLNRRAQKIAALFDDHGITEIRVYDNRLELFFAEDRPISWELQEFVNGSPLKNDLHNVFGNYTPGALHDFS